MTTHREAHFWLALTSTILLCDIVNLDGWHAWVVAVLICTWMGFITADDNAQHAANNGSDL